MRILHIAEAFGGGLFEITRMQAEGQAELGHEVMIAYGRRPETPDVPRAVIDPRVALVDLQWDRSMLSAHIAAFRKLRSLLKLWQPDIVHLQSSFAGMIGALATGRRATTVYTPQGYAFTMNAERGKRALYRSLEMFVASSVDMIGASSATEADQARSLGTAKAVTCVPNGVQELDGELPDRAAPQRRRVICLGRPSPQRRPEACARLLAAVQDVADVRWVGGGPESPGLDALNAAGIPVTGWLPREQTIREIDAASIYVHWTAWDGLPLSILEALARDVVVVASDIGPNREVLGADQVFDDEQRAAEHIRALITDDALYADHLARQRDRRTYFSATRMVEDWIDLYESLLGTEAPTRRFVRADNADLQRLDTAA